MPLNFWKKIIFSLETYSLSEHHSNMPVELRYVSDLRTPKIFLLPTIYQEEKTVNDKQRKEIVKRKHNFVILFSSTVKEARIVKVK